ncbi:Uncharacterised protein [Serratia proteamaculans]|nr:Uncharacterised protein [Serratia proteamaculans]
MGLAVLVLRLRHRHILAAQRHVFAGHQLGTGHRQVVTGPQRQVAIHAAEGTALIGQALRGIGGFQAFGTVADADATAAHQAGFFLLFEVQFAVALGRASHGQIVTRQQFYILSAGHAATLHAQIVTCQHVDAFTAQGAALGGLAIEAVAGGRGGFRHQAVAAGHLMTFVQIASVLTAEDVDVMTGIQVKRLTGGNRCRTGIEIVARVEGHGPLADHFAAHLLAVALFQAVITVPNQVVTAGGGHRIQVEIAPGIQHRLAVLTAVNHLRRIQFDVATGLQHQLAVGALHIHARHAVDVGALETVGAVNGLRRTGGADGVNVTPGAGQQRVVALDHAANIVNVGTGNQAYVGALNIARHVGDVGRAQLHHFATGDMATVKQAFPQIEVDVAPGNQGAGTVQIARLHAGIHLRHQHVLLAAVRQRDLGIHQPDDVFGQQPHLLWRQRHTNLQVILLAKGQPLIHQGLELFFVIVVTFQVTLAGQIDHLFADQPLLVVAIAQTLQHVVLVIGGLGNHIVRTQPGFLVGEAWIGFHQILPTRCRIGFEQAVVRQASVRPDNAYHAVYRVALLTGYLVGDFKLLARLQGHSLDHRYRTAADALHPGGDITAGHHRIHPSSRADGGIGTLWRQRRNGDRVTCNLPVVDQLARFQRNGLNGGRRRIGRGVMSLLVLAFLLDAVVIGHFPGVGSQALARHRHVIHAAGINRQRTARDHLALIIEQMTGVDRHIATGDYLGRIAFLDLGFLHRTVEIELVVVVFTAVRRVEVVHLIVGDADLVRLITLVGAAQLVFGQLVAGYRHQLGAEVVIDVIDLPGRQRHVTGRLNSRTVVVEGARLSAGKIVGIKLAANRHIATAVDQPVPIVVQRLGANIHPLAPGQRGGGAVLRQVVEGDSLHADGVTINPAGSNVGQRVGRQQGVFAVNQTVVGQGAVHRQPVLPGIDLTAGNVEQVVGVQIKLGTRQQFTAVGNITRRGEVEIAIGDHLAAVIDTLRADQLNVAQRQQLSVAADRCGIDVQQLARLEGTGGIQQV